MPTFGRAALAAAALSIAACAATATRAAATVVPATPASAAPVRAVTAAEVLGEVRAARGSVVLVNVWATWCVPCREEFPDLLRLQRELGPRGLRIVFVSADLKSQLPEVGAFLRGQGVRFPTFIKAQADQEFIEGLDKRWSGALPADLLFDRQGKKVGFWEGGSTYAQVLARVEPLLEIARTGKESS